MTAIIQNLKSKNTKIEDLISDIRGKNPNFHSFSTSDPDMKKAPSISSMENKAQVRNKREQELLDKYDSEIAEIIIYNKSVLDLDELYNIAPLDVKMVVIRMFLKDPITVGGVNIKGIDQIPIRTQNGQGILKMVDNPFRFKRLGVVVGAHSKNEILKRGDIVATDHIMVMAPIPGEESLIEYGGNFTHYSYSYPNPPKNYDDQHFGYILVPSSFVQYVEGNIFTDIELGAKIKEQVDVPLSTPNGFERLIQDSTSNEVVQSDDQPKSQIILQ